MPKRTVHRLDAEIRRLNAEGLSDSKIARQLGTHRTYVQKRRNAMGLKPKHYHLWTAQEKRELLSAAMTEEGRKEFARRIGVSMHGLRCKIKSFGEGQDTNWKLNRAMVRKSRAWAMLLDGRPVAEVAAIVGVDDTMVRRYRSEMPDWWANELNGIDGGRACRATPKNASRQSTKRKSNAAPSRGT